MSLSLSAQRVRIACDPLSHDGLTCRLQGSTPKVWRGTDVDIEVGLYWDGAFVDTLTGITSLHLDILPGSDRDGAPLLQAADASLDTISEVEWTGNTASKFHGKFSLTRAQTQFDMTDAADNVLSLWMVVHALMATGAYITVGAGQLLVEEDGAQNGLAVVTSPSPAARLVDGELQLLNADTGTWHTVVVRGQPGAEYLSIAVGEA